MSPHAEPSLEVTVFPGRTGRGVRIAVIDSGVNAAHPHIGNVAGGVTIGTGSERKETYPDLMGHGTAVMAAIKEKAPEAEYYAVRVFDSSLRTSIGTLLRAIEWCIDHKVHLINLSLGTSNASHAALFRPLIERAAGAQILLISALEAGGAPALPGTLPGVIGAGLDWNYPRGSFRANASEGDSEFYASGYPRPLPGLSKERNLHGISFAVANMTGFAARACQDAEYRDYTSVCSVLAAEAARIKETEPRP